MGPPSSAAAKLTFFVEDFDFDCGLFVVVVVMGVNVAAVVVVVVVVVLTGRLAVASFESLSAVSTTCAKTRSPEGTSLVKDDSGIKADGSRASTTAR